MSEKRIEPFWQLPGWVKKFDDGAELREESIGADHVLIHVTVPKTVDSERMAAFARNFSKELPKNARAIFTCDDIQIKVHRPRSVSLSMVGNKIEGDALIDQIRQPLEDSNITNINLHVQDNIIEQSVPKPLPIPVVEEPKLRGNNGHRESRITGQSQGEKTRRSPQKKGGNRKVKST
jgi:hypothetical protein